jgi:hypothetical protein
MVRQPAQSWREKIHPAFIEIAQLRRALVEAQKQPVSKRADAVDQVLRQTAEKRDQLLEHYPDLSPRPSWSHVAGSGYQHSSAGEKVNHVFEYHFFKRFRVPLRLALQRENMGDLNAHNQIVRARDEFWKLAHGYRVPRYKVSEIHSDLIELGLNLGLNRLTFEELAECFDDMCPCGREHAADALKRQFKRVEQQLKNAFQKNWLLASPRERYAVYGTLGYVAKAYRPSQGEPYVEISRKGKGLEYVIYADGLSGFTKELTLPQAISLLPGIFFLERLDDIFRMLFPVAKDNDLEHS